MKSDDKFKVYGADKEEVGYSVGAAYTSKEVTITLMKRAQDQKNMRSFLMTMTASEAIDLGKQLIDMGTKVRDHK